MTSTVSDKREAFRRLHESGCFVLPNPWDVGSAVILQHLGFQALATTSAGMAWAMGRADGAVSLDEVMAHLASLAQATDLPLNADFENGFADAPADVARNVARAVEIGVAGLSVEDYPGGAASGLYDFSLAVERIAAAREAIDKAGGGVVLTARSEGFIRGAPDMDETLKRLDAYARAGADCLYAPGLRQEEQVRTVVAACAPKPVNILAPGLSVETLARLGARRISIGGSLASVAYRAFYAAAQEIAEKGDFTTMLAPARGVPLNPIFAGR
jgi:2-methylisocitrate lyase-like PEP mutase family enzyme